MRRLYGLLLLVAQVVLGARVITRMIRTAGGKRLERAATGERCVMLLPVLNEEARLGPCLSALAMTDDAVDRIVVIDGGSMDGTREIVETTAAKHPRIELLTAGAAPEDVNGKAWQLQRGLDSASGAGWILTIDADVEVAPQLPASLMSRATADGLRLLSVGTSQRVADPLDAALHPSMLTTLVYRFGIPGAATTDPAEVQANGQCFLIRRDLLDELGGFAAVEGEIAEDVALARLAARTGERVGFVEAGGLATAAMYPSWRQTWEGWLRSLPLSDSTDPGIGAVGLAEVSLVQAAPLILLPFHLLAGHRLAAAVNAGLLATRIGTLAGTRRAYVDPPVTYWLSPLCDPAVAVGLWLSRARRTHRWRGREIRRGDPPR